MAKLHSWLEEIETISIHGNCDREVRGVACDSRQVRPDYIFVAIAGHNQDGWSYADEALSRGASVVVSEHHAAPVRKRNGGRAGRANGVCHVRVPDARLAAALLAGAFYGEPSRRLEMIGITGTNGKTTTAYLARDILEAAGKSPGVLSTIRYEIGGRTIPAVRTTPEAPVLHDLLAQMVSAGCRSAVMEVSSHALEQKRVAGVDFDVAVFTNLTRDHLDYHGTMETYFEAKAQLFIDLGKNGGRTVGIVNVDDEWGRKLAGLPGLKTDILTLGTGPDADLRAVDVQVTSSGSSFRALTPWGQTAVTTRLLGRFNVSNALAALGACGSLDVDIHLAARVLEQTTSVSGRLEEMRSKLGYQVFVDYAHTDDALKNVLQTLREVAGNRLLAVFGCGGNRDASKRPAMGRVAEELADFTVLTSDNPRGEDPQQIVREIEAGFENSGNYEVIEDRREAIEHIISLARKGDVILIAGKGHENFQEFARKTVPFDDRQVVEEAMRNAERGTRNAES